jgi:hypothetical protein
MTATTKSWNEMTLTERQVHHAAGHGYEQGRTHFARLFGSAATSMPVAYELHPRDAELLCDAQSPEAVKAAQDAARQGYADAAAEMSEYLAA